MSPTSSSQEEAFDTSDYRVKHLRTQAHSGLSVAEYCRRHHLCAATFYNWRRMAREDASQTRLPGTVSFTEIARMGEAQGQWVAEVVLTSGAMVRLSAAADARLLRMVVEALS